MGAKNHQPTSNRLTAISAWVSQRVGEGIIFIQQANNHLEDAIMIGMDRLYVEDLAQGLRGSSSESLRKSIEVTRASEEVPLRIQSGFARMLEAAESEHYVGNPLASRVNTLDLKECFEGILIQPFVNDRAWNEVHERIRTMNILKTLEWESSEFGRLTGPTRLFRESLEECLRIAERNGARAFVDAVENNQVPVRQFGAQVFSMWNNLDAVFLYSSLIMTELFYQMNAYPSLVQFDPTRAQWTAA